MCSTRPFAPRPTRCAVCRVGYSLPFITPPRPTDCRSAPSRGIRQPAGKICISVSLGRSSLAGGGFLFPPCLRAFSPAARNLPRFPLLPPPALGRVTAASYSGAALGARFARARWHCGGYHPYGVRARCGRTRPATQAAERGNFRRSSVAGVPLRGQYAHASTKKKSVRLERPSTDDLRKIVVRHAFTICEVMPLCPETYCV